MNADNEKSPVETKRKRRRVEAVKSKTEGDEEESSSKKKSAKKKKKKRHTKEKSTEDDDSSAPAASLEREGFDGPVEPADLLHVVLMPEYLDYMWTNHRLLPHPPPPRLLLLLFPQHDNDEHDILKFGEPHQRRRMLLKLMVTRLVRVNCHT